MIATVVSLPATIAALKLAMLKRRNHRHGSLSCRAICQAALVAALFLPTNANAAGLVLPPIAVQGLDLLYSGHGEQAIGLFQQLQRNTPDHPLGYLLEADARWWQIYCEACEIKWNMIDAWKAKRDAADDDYFALTGKAAQLAEEHIARSDSAEMELYAGMSLLLRARLLGLLDSRRATAQAGVRAREHLLRCLALDPQMADAYAGLGLYDYYVDTLSAFAKVLRFFMGIPGGDKRDGVRQLHIAIEQGVLTRVEARYYLAKNLRNYDLDYASSVELMTPLTTEYPQNPFFRLLMGDVQAKLGHRDAALTNFHAAEQDSIANPVCGQRIRSLSEEAQAQLTQSH